MPSAVFPEELLRPEKQDPDAFVRGIDAIVEAQRTVALHYFEDGSVEAACPPIKALLHIMAYGEYEGLRETDPDLRAMFTQEALLESEWYKSRLRAKQTSDIALWTRHREALERFLASGIATDQVDLQERLEFVRGELARVRGDHYPDELIGTLGLDPSV